MIKEEFIKKLMKKAPPFVNKEGLSSLLEYAYQEGYKEAISSIWHSIDEIPKYPCDILYVMNVDNFFLYRYMENGRPVNPPETPYFRDVTNGKCWCYCKDLMV